MVDIFHNIISWIESSKYVLIFIGTIFEGPIVMMTSGFLYKLGGFSLWPMYAALVLGDLVADIGWYIVGRFGGRKFIFKHSKFFKITPERLNKVEEIFHKHQIKILLISKLTMGLGFAFIILIVAGIFKVDFKKYMTLNLIGGFVWTAIVIAIGYFLGNVYTIIPESIKIVFLVFVFTIFILGIRYINKYLKSQNL